MAADRAAADMIEERLRSIFKALGNAEEQLSIGCYKRVEESMKDMRSNLVSLKEEVFSALKDEEYEGIIISCEHLYLVNLMG